MRNSSCLPALAAATLVSGAASATPITVGDSVSLVIDVEFWGRQQLTSENPTVPGEDIISYGDPVQGSFRISTDDAPAPIRTSAFEDATKAVVYGRDTTPVGNPSPASFVTSSWSSTFAFHRDVLPVPGGEADDFVTVGNGVQFSPDEPIKDWFQVADAYTANSRERDEIRHDLAISVSTPLDVIQGVGLDQEFELVDPEENGGGGYGFFRTTVDGATKFFEFIVDRVRVSKLSVCRP